MSKIQQEIEKLANEYADKHGFRVPYDGSNKFYNDDDVKWSKEGFIAGYKAALQSDERIKSLESKVDKLSGLHTVFGPLPIDDKKDLAEIEHYFKSALQNKVSEVSAEEVLRKHLKPLFNHEGDLNDFFEVRGEELIAAMQEYASLVNERKQLDTDKLYELDQILASFEDWMHDEDGKKVTKARGIIIELQKGERKDNVGVPDLHILKQIRNYFGENDAPVFHHTAYSVIDKIIKKAESQPQNNVGVNDAVEFAWWIHANYEEVRGRVHGWRKRNIDGEILSAEALYKIFQQSQPQQKDPCFYMPPDHGDTCWIIGSENFTRKEVADMLHTQRAMICNDLKTYAGESLTPNLLDVLKNPRIPEY